MRIQQANRHSRKRIFSLPLYVYLSYLAVCTLLFTGVSFSRYISAANGSNSIRVASAGEITVNYGRNSAVQISQPTSPENQLTGTFPFNVSNANSEVAIRYDIVVQPTQPLPEGVRISLDGKEPTGSDKEYRFSNVGSFDDGTNKINFHTLSFTGDYSTIQTDYSSQITISIQATQDN